MIGCDYASILKEFEHTMGHQEFINKFEIELPTQICAFVMGRMVELLGEVGVETSKIEFLRFYPYLREVVSGCIGRTEDIVVKQVFFVYSQSLVQFWTKALNDVAATVEKFKKVNLNSAFLNRMMMLYLIQELSNDCAKKIRKAMGSSRYKLINKSADFVRWMMERLEVFEWRLITEEDWPKFDQILGKKYTSESAQNYIQVFYDKSFEELKSTPCKSKKGGRGVLVCDPVNTQKGQYLLRENDKAIVITNSRYLDGWSKVSFELKHKTLEMQLKQYSLSGDQTPITNPLTNITTSIGYLLANMPDRPTKFLKQFFMTAAISGSMTAILSTIPMLGKLILLGGLSYQAADVLKNADIETKKKIEKIIGISFTMGVTVSTSLAGAVAGQVLIPIPILGAFVGATFGGIIGGYGTNAVTDKFQKFRVKRMISALQEKQNHDGSWQVAIVLDTFDLKQSFFTKHSTQQVTIKLKDIVTLFTYFVLSLFESQRQQLQIAQLQDKCKKKWYRTPTEQQISDIKQQIDQMVQDVPQVLLHTEVYMVVHDLKLVDNISVLQKMMEQFLAVL